MSSILSIAGCDQSLSCGIRVTLAIVMYWDGFRAIVMYWDGFRSSAFVGEGISASFSECIAFIFS